MSQPRWDPDERRWLLDRHDVPSPGRRRRPAEFDERSGIDVDARERDARSARAPLSVAELTRTELDEDRDPRLRSRDRDDRGDRAPRPSPAREVADPPRPSPHGGGRRRAADDGPPERSRATGTGRYDERPPAGSAGAGSAPGAEPDERRPGDALDDRGTGSRPSVRRDGYGARRRDADRYGADRNGVDRFGTDRNGADRNGVDRYDADRFGADRNGVDPHEPARFGTDRDSTDVYGAHGHGAGRYDALGSAALNGHVAGGYEADGHGARGYARDRRDGDGDDRYAMNGYGARVHDGPRSRRHDADEQDAAGSGTWSRNGARRYDERADDGYGDPQDGPGRHDADARDAVGYGTPSRNGAAPYSDGHGTRGRDGAGEAGPYGQDVAGHGTRGRAGSARHDADDEDAVGYGAHGHLDEADRRDVDDQDLGYGAYGYDPDGHDDVHGEPDQAAAPYRGGRAARRRAARARQDDGRCETRDLGPAAREDDGYGTGEQVPVAVGAGDAPDDDDRPRRRARRTVRRRWPWVVAGVAVLGGLAVPVVLAMQDGTQSQRVSSSSVGAAGNGADQGVGLQPADDAPPAGEVVFQLTGSGSTNSITFGRGTSISQVPGAQLPWEQTLPGAPGGSEYSLTATGADGTDEIACKITVDGAVVAEQKAEGEYAAVSCNGRR